MPKYKDVICGVVGCEDEVVERKWFLDRGHNGRVRMCCKVGNDDEWYALEIIPEEGIKLHLAAYEIGLPVDGSGRIKIVKE